MNLTSEQVGLLKALVAHYDEGRKGEFIIAEADEGPIVLMYTGSNVLGNRNFAVPGCSSTDFRQLAHEGLISPIEKRSPSSSVSQLTAKGLDVADDRGLRKHRTPEVFRKAMQRNGKDVLMTPPSPPEPPKRIFIGHGHSPVWMNLREFLERKLKLATDEFNRESEAGRSTKEVLQKKLEAASFAFLVMTGEDSSEDGGLRTRENVVHETGLFQGKLGFDRAIILLEKGCKTFSNIHGLTTIEFYKGEIKGAYEDIRDVLEREGIIVNGTHGDELWL